MPQRSNAFQRLILLIEAALAPSKARITESFILKDLTSGTAREIDILIEIPTGPRGIRIAIECRDHSRPATVNWINELTGKYIHLPVDRVVAVSKSGFTKTAREKAAIVKIDLLTIEEANKIDWQAFIPHVEPCLVVGSTRYNWTKVDLIPPLPTGEACPTANPITDLMIYREPARLVTLNEVLHWEITKEPMKNFMLKTWHETPGINILLRLLLSGWYYRDAIGIEHELVWADVELTGQVDWLEFTLHPLIYAGIKIAHAETTIDGESMSVVVVDVEGEEPKWIFYVKDSKDFPWRGDWTSIIGDVLPTVIKLP